MIDDTVIIEQDILRRLSSSDPAEARNAAFEAGDKRLQSAISLLVNLFTSASLGVQEAAEHALRKIRTTKTVQAMLPVLRSENVTQRNIAMDILREIGSDDLPSLTWLLIDDDADIRIFASDILGSTHSTHALTPLCEVLLHDPEVNVRYQAAVSLGELGLPEAAESLKLAIQDDEWVQFAVMEALAKIKAESCVDILVQALDSCSALVASTVLDALGEIGHVKAAPMLLSYIDKTSGPLRTKTVKAIINILGATSLSLLGAKQLNTLRTYMIAGLEDDDEETLSTLLTGLSVVGDCHASKSIIKLIERLDQNTQQDVFQQAAQTLVSIGFNEAIEEALFSENELIRHIIVEVCGTLEERLGIYALKKHFNKLDDNDKQLAMELIALKGDDRDIPFFLEHIHQNENPNVLFHTLRFLGQNMHHVESAADMITLLNHPSDIVKEAALEACLALNDEATFQMLVAQYQSENPTVRKMAIYTMGYVGAEHFVDELAQAVQDPEIEVRKVALESIGYGCPVSDFKLQVLAHCMKDSNKEMRIIATELLGQTGVEAMVNPLLEALQDEDDWVKVRALEALGHNKVFQVAQTLVENFDKASLLVKIKTIEALAEIKGDVAFRALLSYMSYEEDEVQQAAVEAIAKLRNEDEAMKI